jgi:hypothetical protein
MLGVAQAVAGKIVELFNANLEASAAEEVLFPSLILLVAGAFVWITCSDPREGTYPKWLRWIFAYPPLAVGGFGLTVLAA